MISVMLIPVGQKYPDALESNAIIHIPLIIIRVPVIITFQCNYPNFYLFDKSYCNNWLLLQSSHYGTAESSVHIRFMLTSFFCVPLSGTIRVVTLEHYYRYSN